MPRFILAYLRSGADAEGLVFVEKADGARDLRAVQRSGIIEEIFDNGYYLIAIDSERYVSDGSPVALLVSYDVIAHEFSLENEDGSSFTGNARRQEAEED